MTNAQYSYFPLTDLNWLYCWSIPVPACRKNHLTDKSHIFNLNTDFHLKVIKRKYDLRGSLMSYMLKDEYFFLFSVSQLNMSGHHWCFFYVTQVMHLIYVTAFPMNWGMGIKDKQLSHYKLRANIYLKSKSKSPFLQHIVLPSFTLWVWSSTSIQPFETHLVSKHSCQFLTWHQPQPDGTTW